MIGVFFYPKSGRRDIDGCVMSIKETKEKLETLKTAAEQARQSGTALQEIQLYPEQQENGQVLKSMKFKFPVFYNGQMIEEIRWDKENTVETVVLMSREEKNYVRRNLSCSG